MADQTPEPAPHYSMRDLEYEISDALWELSGTYWDPIEEIANRYLTSFESTPRIIEGLASLAEIGKEDGEFFARAYALAATNEADVDRWLNAELQLEDQYEARRDLILEWITHHVTDRFMEKHANIRTARSTVETVEWIGLAIAGGVAGNLSYDILKKGWEFGWRGFIRRFRRPPAMSGVDLEQALIYLVKVAIREQCRRVQFPIPDFDTLSITGWHPGAQSVVADVRSTSPVLHAFVEMPYFGLEDHGIRVSVSRPNP